MRESIRNEQSATCNHLNNVDHTSAYTISSSAATQINNTTLIVTPDTACTGHYLPLDSRTAMLSMRPCTTDDSITVVMPNGTRCRSTHIGDLPILQLPIAARICHLIPQFSAAPLLSIPLLCDHGCEARFTADEVCVLLGGEVILRGSRCPRKLTTSTAARLWTITLESGLALDEGIAQNVIRHETVAQRMMFYSGVMGCPVNSTLQATIDAGYLDTFPLLSSADFRANAPTRVATALGHLDQSRQGQRSTQPKPLRVIEPVDETESDYHPLLEKPSHFIYARVHGYEGRQHVDATGRFPYTSAAGTAYCMVFYGEDSNYIHVEPLPSRSAAHILAAYQRSHKFFAARGVTPRYVRLDNEASTSLKEWLGIMDVALELVPPHSHRRNRAERAIRTFKNHFVAILCNTAPDFPMAAWDELLPHTELTLNLMRSSRVSRLISAWAQLHGTFDYNRHPLAVPGTAVIAHEMPDQRDSWGPHGKPAFYLGTAMEHYRCHRVWIPSLSSVRVVSTVAWYPEPYYMPGASLLEMLTAAVTDLTAIVQQCLVTPITQVDQPQAISTMGPTALAQLHRLRDMFVRAPVVPAAASSSSTLCNPASQSILSGSSAAAYLPPPGLTRRPTEQRVPEQRVQTPIMSGEHVGLPAEVLVLSPPSSSVQVVHDTTVMQPPSPASLPVDGANLHARTGGNNFTYQQHLQQRAHRRRKTKTAVVPAVFVVAPPDPAPILPSANCQPVPVVAPRVQTRAQRSAQGVMANVVTAEDTLAACRAALAIHDRKTTLMHGDDFAYHCACAATDHVTGKPLKWNACKRGPDKAEWEKKDDEEIERLVDTTKTMRFIPHTELPKGRKPSYYNRQLSEKPNSDGISVTKRVRGTIGGDQIVYTDEKSAQTASLTTVKAVLNSVVSGDDIFITADIKDYYLGTDLPYAEYMWLKYDDLSAYVRDKYHLCDIVYKGRVLVMVVKGIYGLPQAGFLAKQRLTKHLAGHGYIECKNTPCLFKHISRPTVFTLIVDDFGIKTKSIDEANHLIEALREIYELKVDYTGAKYLGIQLDWDLTPAPGMPRSVRLSIPGYVHKGLARFDVIVDTVHPTDSPGIFVPPKYGRTAPQTASRDDTRPLSPVAAKRIQEITGTFLYYARAVDPTMLRAINRIGSAQSRPTQAVETDVQQFLQYAGTHPDAGITYYASDMILFGHTDGSYLCESSARSRAGGLFFLSSRRPDGAPPLVNGPILCISKIFTVVLSSAAETEYGSVFVGCQEAEPLRSTLEDLEHPQGATSIQCDNKCAVGLANNTVKERMSKAVDMRFHWIRDRVKQGHFTIEWRRGTDNLADYFTKEHPLRHFRTMRSFFVTDPADKPMRLTAARHQRLVKRATSQ